MKDEYRGGTNVAPQKRRYLKASKRKQEILDAAFKEFSNDGFLATSLERIANRAGISKSGIYAHYKSKNDIFEDMLAVTLLPSNPSMPDLDIEGTPSLADLIESYLSKRYSMLSSPKAVAVFRLLIAESGRAPNLVQQTVNNLLKRFAAEDQSFIQKCLNRKLIPTNIKIEEYLLASSPAGLWLILATIFNQDGSPVPMDNIKSLHKNLLLDLLNSKM